MRISHEAIYQALYIEGRGALKRELVACLRTGRALRKPRERQRNRPQGHVTADVVLSERPAEAEDRAVPGSLGRRPDHRVEPLGDRHGRGAHQPLHAAGPPAPTRGLRDHPAGQERTRPRRLRRHRHEGRTQETMTTMPAELLRSLTWDRGKELSAHAQFKVDTGIAVYFADPLLALAARHEREHERPAAPVLPKGHRPVPLECRGPSRRPGGHQQQTAQSPRSGRPRPRFSMNSYGCSTSR